LKKLNNPRVWTQGISCPFERLWTITLSWRLCSMQLSVTVFQCDEHGHFASGIKIGWKVNKLKCVQNWQVLYWIPQFYKYAHHYFPMRNCIEWRNVTSPFSTIDILFYNTIRSCVPEVESKSARNWHDCSETERH
jgi:hypothetical protein